MERYVVIYVSRNFRNKIKELKRELSYEQYFENIIKNGNPAPQRRKAEALGRKST